MLFEQFGGFSKGFEQNIYDLKSTVQRTSLPRIPPAVSGSGPNMAFKMSVLRERWRALTRRSARAVSRWVETTWNPSSRPCGEAISSCTDHQRSFTINIAAIIPACAANWMAMASA